MKAIRLPSLLGKSLSPFLTLVLVLSVILPSCGSRKSTVNTNTPHENSEESTRLNVKSTASSLDTVVILSINDPHAALDQFPRFAFMVDSLRAIYPDLLLFAAGDLQSGNPVNDQYSLKGYPIIGLMNALGFTHAAVGNHEFDTGQEGFGLLTRVALFPFLAANVYPDDKWGIKIEPYVIETLANGRKIAILGLLQLEKNGLPSTHPTKVEGIQFEYAQKIAPQYRSLKDSSDVVIALTHLGINEDKEIAKANPWLDLIVGGHSHTFINDALMEGNVPITQSGARLTQAAISFIELDDMGNIVKKRVQSLPVDKKAGSEKASIRKLVDKFTEDSGYRTIVATAEYGLHDKVALGYMMCDAYRTETGSDFAFQNNGGVRLPQIPKGPITLLDIYTLDPFGNEMVTINLTPQEIRNFLIFSWEQEEREPMLSSGLHIIYYLNPDGSLGNLEITDEKGVKLDKKKLYKVAYNSYIDSAYPYQHADVPLYKNYISADTILRYLQKLGKVGDYSNEKRSRIIREEKITTN